MTSELGTVRVVYADRPGIHEIPAEHILTKREGSMVIIDADMVSPEGMSYVFQDLLEYAPETDEVIYVWKKYVGKDYPKVYPRYEILEDAPDYMIVQRLDGQLFKITDNLTGEILGNIYINPGKSLWDLIVLESMIEAKERPERYENEEYRIRYAEKVVDAIGVLTYLANLVELKP